MAELKPCPFCGEVFRLGGLYIADFAGGGSAVKCPTCGLTGNIRTTGEAAIAAWNKAKGRKKGR